MSKEMKSEMQISRRSFLSVAGAAMIAAPIINCGKAFAGDFLGVPVLTDEEISEKLRQIGRKYAVGEYLSEVDADFVRRYAETPSKARAQDYDKFIDKDVSGFGTVVHLNGRIFHTGTFDYKYVARIIARQTSGTTLRKISMGVDVTAYGLGVSGGLFVVHSGSLTHSATNTRNTSMDKERSYSGVVTHYTLSSYVDVVTSSGSSFQRSLG